MHILFETSVSCRNNKKVLRKIFISVFISKLINFSLRTNPNENSQFYIEECYDSDGIQINVPGRLKHFDTVSLAHTSGINSHSSENNKDKSVLIMCFQKH